MLTDQKFQNFIVDREAKGFSHSLTSSVVCCYKIRLAKRSGIASANLNIFSQLYKLKKLIKFSKLKTEFALTQAKFLKVDRETSP